MPYALTAAAISFITYVVAGFVQNPVICLLFGVVLTIAVMYFLHRVSKTGLTNEE
jgi:uncharacterized membrane protein YfcA